MAICKQISYGRWHLCMYVNQDVCASGCDVSLFILLFVCERYDNWLVNWLGS